MKTFVFYFVYRYFVHQLQLRLRVQPPDELAYSPTPSVTKFNSYLKFLKSHCQANFNLAVYYQVKITHVHITTSLTVLFKL